MQPEITQISTAPSESLKGFNVLGLGGDGKVWIWNYKINQWERFAEPQ